MVPRTKHHSRVFGTPTGKAPLTLRNLCNRAPDARLRSSPHNLAFLRGVPLESMPVDLDGVDAPFARENNRGLDSSWTSKQAYRGSRTAVRGAIRRHLVIVATTGVHVCPLNAKHTSITRAQ